MIMMYWTGDAAEQAPAAPAWSKLYKNFKVFSDDEVRELLPDDFKELFDAIRLPSAKSDLARFVLLREFGGLYIDAHFGPTDSNGLVDVYDLLSTYNLVLFGKGWAMVKDSDFDLMNGVVAARRFAPELDLIINRIMTNIREQREKEVRTNEYVPYGLFGLTGTYVLVSEFFEHVNPRPRIKQAFTPTVGVHFMDDNRSSGFEIAAYYNYRRPNEHWSEREKKERFFLD